MKKIDANKSLIFCRNIEDLQNSLEYLNLDGYFSNSDDFSEYEEATLDIVQVAKFVSSIYWFVRDGNVHGFIYFIPKTKAVFVEEEPKQKTLRAFKSIEEFFNITGFTIGDVVKIKNFVGYKYEETSILNGFRVYTDETYAIFGAGSRSFDELFKHYKYYKNGKWCRFGIEE